MKLPLEALLQFKRAGRKGSKQYWDGLTPEQRSARAKKAARKIPKDVRVERAQKAGLAAAKKRKKGRVK